MNVFLYRITDLFGKTDQTATDDVSLPIILRGKEGSGKNRTFEDVPYELADFAESVGWTVEKFTLLVDLDTQKVISLIQD